MEDVLGILIKAIISEIDTKDLQKLADKIAPIKIKAEIDGKEFKNLNQQISELKKQVNTSMNMNLKTDSAIKELTEFTKIYKNGSQEVSTLIQKGTNDLKQQVTVTKQLSIETEKLEEVERRIRDTSGADKLQSERKAQEQLAKAMAKDVEDQIQARKDKEKNELKYYAEEQKMIDEIEGLRLQSIERRKQEESKWNETQSKYINKAIDDNKGLEEQEQLRITRLGTKLQEVKDIDWTDADSIKNWTKSLENTYTKVENFKVKTEAAGNKVAQFNTVLRDGSDYIKVHKNVLDQNTNSLYEQSEAIKPNINRMLGFGEQLKIAIERSITWGAAMTILYGSLRKLKEGIAFIIELDKTLNSVRVITGQTQEQTVELAKSYADLGFSMGKTVKEISSVSAELFRQGLAMDEVDKRMKSIMQLSAIEGITTEDSMSIITSSVNALGEETEKTTDVLLKAGAISASSAKDIGVAMTKMASSAKSAGMDIEESSAMLSALIDITQESPETLGNSLKTIIANFNRVDEETGELNENINAVGNSFASVGIQFKDTEGQIRPVGELLTELSGKWGTLDKNTKSFLANQAAGTRQQNRFLALMDNYNRVLEYQGELYNAAGTTAIQYGIYIDSIEASANRAKAAFEKMFINALSSDMIKDFYDLSAGVTKAIDKIGLFKVAIFAINAAFLATTKNGQGFINNIIEGFTEVETKGKVVRTTITSIGGALKKIEWGKMLGGVILGGLTAAAMTALTILISKFFTNLAKANEQQKKLIETQKAEYAQTKQNIAQIEALNSMYITAEVGSKEYLETREQMARLMPQMIKYYDKEGNAVYANANEVRALLDEQKKLNIENAKTVSMSIAIEMEDDFKELDKTYKDIEKTQQDFNERSEMLKVTSFVSKFIEENNLDKLDKYSKEFKQKESELLDTVGKMFVDLDISKSTRSPFAQVLVESDGDLEAIRKAIIKEQELLNQSDANLRNFNAKKDEKMSIFIQGLKEYNIVIQDELEITDKNIMMILDSYVDSFEEKNNITKENLDSMISLSKTGQEELAKILQSLTNNGKIDLSELFKSGDFATFEKELTKSLGDTSVSSKVLDSVLAELKDQMNDTSNSANDMGNTINDTSSKIVESASEISDTIDEISKVEGILDKLNKEGMSLDVVQSLSKSYPELLQYYGDEVKLRQELISKTSEQYNLLNDYLNVAGGASNEVMSLVNSEQALAQALEQSYNKGVVSKQLMEQLMDIYPALRAVAVQTADGYVIEGNTLIGATEGKLKAIQSLINAEKVQTERVIANINARINAYKLEAQSFQALSTDEVRYETLLRKSPVLNGSLLKSYQSKLNGLKTSSASIATSLGRIGTYSGKNTYSPPSSSGSGSSGSGSSGSSGSSATEKDNTSELLSNWIDVLAVREEILNNQLELNKINQSYSEALGEHNSVVKLQLEEIEAYKTLNKVYQSNISLVQAKMKEYSSTSDEYAKLNDLLQKYTLSIKQNEVAIVNLKNTLKEYDRSLRDSVIKAQELVLESVKNRVKLEYEANKQILEDKISFLEKEKQLLRKNYDARKQEKDEQDKRERLAELEKRYNKLSLDNSGIFAKEKLDLDKQIKDLREEIYEDSLLKEVESQEKAIDEQISNYEKQKSALEEQYELMEENTRAYWAEVDNIMKSSQSNILTFLKENSEEYKTAGKLQREAYLEGWGETIDFAKGIMDGSIKPSSEIANTVTPVATPTSPALPSTKPTTTPAPSGGSSSPSASKPQVSSVSATLRNGSRGESVKLLQRALNMVLGTNLAVDGIFGAKTKNAVVQFQRNQGIASDGIVGRNTKSKFKVLGYKEGGVVDYTGLAMVHGSKDKPETFLDANQTSIMSRFMKALEKSPFGSLSNTKLGYLKGSENQTIINNTIGDVIVQVEKLEDDVDFDNVGEKVKNSIYDSIKSMGLQLSISKMR